MNDNSFCNSLESTSLPLGLRQRIAEILGEVFDKLEQGGVCAAIDFRPEILSQQLAWPADAPLAEPELRAEVQDLLQKARALRQRATTLFKSLPEPTVRETENEIPESLYFSLHDALFFFSEGGLDEVVDQVETCLAKTPESLRSAWFRWTLTQSLEGILPRETVEILASRWRSADQEPR